MRTYPSVCADMHLQPIVLAESFVTVRTLVRTLTWGATTLSECMRPHHWLRTCVWVWPKAEQSTDTEMFCDMIPLEKTVRSYTEEKKHKLLSCLIGSVYSCTFPFLTRCNELLPGYWKSRYHSLRTRTFTVRCSANVCVGLTSWLAVSATTGQLLRSTSEAKWPDPVGWKRVQPNSHRSYLSARRWWRRGSDRLSVKTVEQHMDVFTMCWSSVR